MSAKPLIVAALGARGTGKSAYVKQRLEQLRPARLAVWDLMQEYGDVPSTSKLGDAIRAMRARRFAVAFQPSRDDATRARQFDTWCRAVLLAGDVLAIVEELRFVTTASHAPGPWREMTLLGRHDRHRVSIIGTSQRPAHIDKDFLGNADVIHCGRLTARADARVAAEVLGVDFRDVLALPDLAYIERASSTSTASRGTLKFRAARPAAARARPVSLVPRTKEPRAHVDAERDHSPPRFSLEALSPTSSQPE